jgi:hypothetical protein
MNTTLGYSVQSTGRITLHKDLVEYLEEKLDEFEGSIDSLVMYTQIVYDGSCYTASPKLLASMERLGKW